MLRLSFSEIPTLTSVLPPTTKEGKMSQPKNSLSDLDRHIKLLEDKVNQLRTSLTVWQKWYLDYSALKEEVEQLSKDPSPREELARIRRDFESDLLTEKEIGEIFGQNDLNEREQIIGVLSRRTDYVEQNIGSLEKLIEAEENKLAAVSIVAYPGADTDEDSGLPITDIIEELDDDDNVVEFRLQSGSDVPIKVLDALKKAGIHDLPETEADLLNNRTLPASGETGQAPEAELASPVPPSVVVTPSPTPAEVDSPSTKKSVSFSQDTKPPNGSDQPPKSMAARKLEEIMQKVKEYEAIDLSKAVIPDNESAEDSELRRQMLQYGMSEIGPVVAELELDDGTPDDEEDEDWDDEDDDEGDDEDDDEDEDELGRSKHSVITSGYIKRMQELEKRLGVKSAFTVEGPESRPRNPDETVAGVGRISV
ncbi:Prefoldin subunit-domain-containing protein, partial [Lasiosphaeria ovina]